MSRSPLNIPLLTHERKVICSPLRTEGGSVVTKISRLAAVLVALLYLTSASYASENITFACSGTMEWFSPNRPIVEIPATHSLVVNLDEGTVRSSSDTLQIFERTETSIEFGYRTPDRKTFLFGSLEPRLPWGTLKERIVKLGPEPLLPSVSI